MMQLLKTFGGGGATQPFLNDGGKDELQRDPTDGPIYKISTRVQR